MNDCCHISNEPRPGRYLLQACGGGKHAILFTVRVHHTARVHAAVTFLGFDKVDPNHVVIRCTLEDNSPPCTDCVVCALEDITPCVSILPTALVELHVVNCNVTIQTEQDPDCFDEALFLAADGVVRTLCVDVSSSRAGRYQVVGTHPDGRADLEVFVCVRHDNTTHAAFQATGPARVQGNTVTIEGALTHTVGPTSSRVRSLSDLVTTDGPLPAFPVVVIDLQGVGHIQTEQSPDCFDR